MYIYQYIMKATSHIYDTEVNITIFYFMHFHHSTYIVRKTSETQTQVTH